MTPSGNILVTWVSSGYRAFNEELHAQLYSPTGEVIGSTISLGEDRSDYHYLGYSVSVTPDGSLISSVGDNTIDPNAQVFSLLGTSLTERFDLDLIPGSIHAGAIAFVQAITDDIFAGAWNPYFDSFADVWDPAYDSGEIALYSTDGVQLSENIQLSEISNVTDVRGLELLSNGRLLVWGENWSGVRSNHEYAQIFSINQIAQGQLGIDGSLQQGQTLSVASGVTDGDGIDTETVAYQWIRDGVDITGATAATYLLTQDDVGAEISVRMSFNDLAGQAESLTSAATAPILNVNDAASGAPLISGNMREGETLSADVGGITDADGIDTRSYIYQWQRDGTDISGATLSSYTLAEEDVGAAISVRVTFTDLYGATETLFSAGSEIVSPADLVLLGTNGPDTLDGRDGNDSLSGLDGDDLLRGGRGERQPFWWKRV